jgi:16S rRNA (uracil1498-N3)-methyltransferase
VKTGLNIERLQKIIREASEQSGRNTVPTLSPILNFVDALLQNNNADEKIIFHLSTAPYSPDKKADKVNIFIGPEGGFTENEIELAKKSGYIPACLGALTLRGETAAIIATYRAVNRI